MKKIILILCLLPLFANAQFDGKGVFHVDSINAAGGINYKGNLENRVVVGASGDFTTFKDAVDWFNSSATENTEILIDCGHYLIDTTITVSNASYALAIHGITANGTYLDASTGLTGYPMFNIESDCDIKHVNLDGSTLAGYGTLTHEDCVVFSNNSAYTELVDITFNGFRCAVRDTVGADFFMFNFIVTDCNQGIRINNTGTSYIDVETGNFENVVIPINFIKADEPSFLIQNIIFLDTVGDTCIKVDPVNFTHGDQASILGCAYNSLGVFDYGWDYMRTDGRDAGVVIFGNPAVPSNLPKGNFLVYNSTDTTRVASAGVYYKARFTITSSLGCKMLVGANKVTSLSHHIRNMQVIITGNVSASAKDRTVDIGLKINGTGSVIDAMTVRTKEAGQPYAFALVGCLNQFKTGDYFEIFLTSSSNGDIITIQDLSCAFTTAN